MGGIGGAHQDGHDWQRWIDAAATTATARQGAGGPGGAGRAAGDCRHVRMHRSQMRPFGQLRRRGTSSTSPLEKPKS